jgi:O-antigen/teichoic acid export membrane protein
VNGFRIKTNVVVSVLAFLVALSSQILIFRIALAGIGLELVGLFALIQGLMLFSRIFEVGVGQNIVRWIALGRDSGEPDLRRWQLAFGALLFVGVPTLVLTAFAFFPVAAYAQRAAPELMAHTLHGLTAISAAIALVSVCNTVVGAVLEGEGRLIWRNLILMGATISGLAFAFPLVARFGIMGYGLVFLVITCLQLVASLVLVLWYYGKGLALGWVGVLPSLREILREHLSMNAIGLIRLSFEPLTRVWLTEFAGLAAVGLFDIMNRLVIAGRSLMQTGVQPLLYFGSRTMLRPTQTQARVFDQAQAIIVRLSEHFAFAILVAAPLVSLLLFDRIGTQEMQVFLLLGLAGAINVLGVVPYYFALSGGAITALLRIHLWMFAINLALPPVLGWNFGMLGVLGGYAVMMAIGGIMSLRLMIFLYDARMHGLWRSAWGRSPIRAYVLLAVVGGVIAAFGLPGDLVLVAGSLLTSILVAISSGRLLARASGAIR